MSTKITTDEMAELTVPEGDWLAASARLTDAAVALTGRDDVIVSIAPGAGHGAPACWLQAQAVIEVDGGRLEVQPADLTPARYSTRAGYAATWGTLCHEAAHVRYTHWVAGARKLWTEAKTRADKAQVVAWVEAAKLLEEHRIEYHYSWDRPWDTRWLRAASVRHLLGEVREAEGQLGNRSAAARAVALLLAREAGGILRRSHVRKADTLIRETLGDDLTRQLLALCRKARLVKDDDDTDAMLDLGRQWCELTTFPEDGEGGAGTGASGQAMPASGGGGEGDPADTEQSDGTSSGAEPTGETGTADEEGSNAKAGEFGKALAKALSEVAESIDRDLEQDSLDSAQVYDGSSGNFRGPAEYKEEKAPADDVAGASALAARLQKYILPDVTATPVSSALPPGRLQFRQAMARSAQAASGRLPTAQPWQRTRREYHPSPPLRVGIAVHNGDDMSCLRNIAASVTYRLRAAVGTLPGSDTRLVTFAGKEMNLPYKPGIKPFLGSYDQGGVKSTTLAQAVGTLDGMLGLSRPGAGRLLVVVSDMEGKADSRSMPEIKRLIASGCRVMWLDCTVIHGGSCWNDMVPGLIHRRLPFNMTDEAVKIAEDELVAMLTGTESPDVFGQKD